MIKINFISLFCDFLKQGTELGVISAAQDKELVLTQFINPRDFTTNVHRTVDGRPFGGGDGMVMLVEPLRLALESIENRGHVVYLSPQGEKLTHSKVMQLKNKKNITFICGRYGGVDQRFINEYVDEEISIGDYVLSGGELAALVVYDALVRQIDGVLGHHDSSKKDSFSDGLLECPQYTRPQKIKFDLNQKRPQVGDLRSDHDKNNINRDVEVPAVLLSGDHKKIAHWKKQTSLLVTLQKKPQYFLKYLKELNSRANAQNSSEFYNKKRGFLSPAARVIVDLEDYLNIVTTDYCKTIGLSKPKLIVHLNKIKTFFE